MKKLANFISIIGHPLLTIPLYVVIVMFGFEDLHKAATVSFLIIGCVFIPVIVWTYLKTKNGSYTNFDVSNRTQRKSLFRFAIPLSIVVTILLFSTNQSRDLCISVLFGLTLLITSTVVNHFIKSSLHVSLTIYLSALTLSLNYKIAIAIFLFTGLIAWSRIKLGRHTLKEVLFGFMIGIILSALMLLVEGSNFLP